MRKGRVQIIAVLATTIFLLIVCFYESLSFMLLDPSANEHVATSKPAVTTFGAEPQHCFKVVTNTGGWGNRIGPLMCALGLVSSFNSSRSSNLTVLWNAANEGTPGNRIPRMAKTGRGGYSIQDIQKLVSFPFAFAESNALNVLNDESLSNRSQGEVTFYSNPMQADVQSWKHYFNRVQHRVVLEYEAHEQWFEDLHCFNIPLGHPIPGGGVINDFTPEPCWTRYKAFSNTTEFGYLKDVMLPKDDFVDRLIEGTRRIVPKIEFCLPQIGYLVIHARRGDRSSPGTTNDIMAHISKLRGVVSLAIVSENETVKEDLIRQAQDANFSIVAPWCTAENLTQPQQGQQQQHLTTARKSAHYHLPTVSMLQDYFLMASSCGVISDYERDQSSFSTTAALGNGRPMLYPGRSRHHVVQQFIAKFGNEGKTLRNVYFLDTIDQFVERVKDEVIQRGWNGNNGS